MISMVFRKSIGDISTTSQRLKLSTLPLQAIVDRIEKFFTLLTSYVMKF